MHRLAVQSVPQFHFLENPMKQANSRDANHAIAGLSALVDRQGQEIERLRGDLLASESLVRALQASHQELQDALMNVLRPVATS